MLQGVQAERGQCRGGVVAEDAEDAALFSQAIVGGGPELGFGPRFTLVACKVHGGL